MHNTKDDARFRTMSSHDLSAGFPGRWPSFPPRSWLPYVNILSLARSFCLLHKTEALELPRPLRLLHLKIITTFKALALVNVSSIDAVAVRPGAQLSITRESCFLLYNDLITFFVVGNCSSFFLIPISTESLISLAIVNLDPPIQKHCLWSHVKVATSNRQTSN